MIPKKVLVKAYEDYDTYTKLTRAGLIIQDQKEFNDYQGLLQLVKDIKLNSIERIWGRIIVTIL